MIYPEAASTSVSDSTIAAARSFLIFVFFFSLSFFFLFAAPFSLAFAASFRERLALFDLRSSNTSRQRNGKEARGAAERKWGGAGRGGEREKRPFVLLFSSQFRQSPRYDVEFTTHRDISAAGDPRLLSNLVFERISKPLGHG